jgi:hypothetical protein
MALRMTDVLLIHTCVYNMRLDESQEYAKRRLACEK